MCQEVTTNFVLFYFEFVPNMIFAILTMMSVFAKRVLFYHESIESRLLIYLVTVLWQIGVMLCIHLVTTKVGMILIETEVLRESNKTTLNNLDEGVIILNEQSMDTQFMNAAAKNFGKTKLDKSNTKESFLENNNPAQ